MAKQRITVEADTRQSLVKLSPPRNEPTEDGSVGRIAIYGMSIDHFGIDAKGNEVIFKTIIKEFWGETKETMGAGLDTSMVKLIESHDKAKADAITNLQGQIDEFNALE